MCLLSPFWNCLGLTVPVLSRSIIRKLLKSGPHAFETSSLIEFSIADIGIPKLKTSVILDLEKAADDGLGARAFAGLMFFPLLPPSIFRLTTLLGLDALIGDVGNGFLATTFGFCGGLKERRGEERRGEKREGQAKSQ